MKNKLLLILLALSLSLTSSYAEDTIDLNADDTETIFADTSSNSTAEEATEALGKTADASEFIAIEDTTDEVEATAENEAAEALGATTDNPVVEEVQAPTPAPTPDPTPAPTPAPAAVTLVEKDGYTVMSQGDDLFIMHGADKCAFTLNLSDKSRHSTTVVCDIDGKQHLIQLIIVPGKTLDDYKFSIRKTLVR